MTGSHVRTPHPSQVPGYERARALGLTPQLPAQPPRPVTTSSRRLLLGVAAAAGLLVVLVLALAGRDAPGPVVGLVALLGSGVVLVVVVAARRALWREIAAGYCRGDAMVALHTRDPDHRFGESGGTRGAPWDLRGLWRLDEAGDVVRRPDTTVLPPGHYPSPHHPGELELWTGEAWAYAYRRPPTPFT